MSNPADSKKAIKKRRDKLARTPKVHPSGLLDTIESASLAPSSRRRNGQKRGRGADEDEVRFVLKPPQRTLRAPSSFSRQV